MRRAVFGARPSSDLIAAEVCERAFSSSSWPEQRQRDDHRRRLEVHATRPIETKDAGKHLRRDGGDDAVDERRADAQADQRPHVRAAVATDCAPRTKNGQPAHSTTGSASTSSIQLCVRHVEPLPRRWPNIASTMTATVSGSVHQKRRRKSTQLGVLGLVERRHLGLERHAALRAVARVVLADLRVHRAGVDGAATAGSVAAGAAQAPRGAPTQVLRAGSATNLALAARAAEVHRLALVRDAHASTPGVTVMPHTGSFSAMASPPSLCRCRRAWHDLPVARAGACRLVRASMRGLVLHCSVLSWADGPMHRVIDSVLDPRVKDFFR